MELHESDIADELEEETDDAEETEAVDATGITDNVGDPSVEINVEDLIQELEAESLEAAPENECEAKRRLEELMDKKRAERDLEDFEDYDV